MANVFISIANCSSRHSASVGGAADGALFILHRKHTTRTRAAVACVSPIFLQHGPGLQWRVSLSFYNTDPARSGVCLTIFLQHGLGLQWCVSHYLSTTRTQPAELLGKKMKKSVSLGKNLARNTTVGALNIMRDFSQFCTLLWVISYIFIRDAGAPLRPRTRPGNMRTFVVIVTCQHPRQIEPLTIGKSEYCTLQVLQNFLGKYICIYRCENLIQWQTLSFALCYFVCV